MVSGMSCHRDCGGCGDGPCSLSPTGRFSRIRRRPRSFDVRRPHDAPAPPAAPRIVCDPPSFAAPDPEPRGRSNIRGLRAQRHPSRDRRHPDDGADHPTNGAASNEPTDYRLRQGETLSIGTSGTFSVGSYTHIDTAHLVGVAGLDGWPVCAAPALPDDPEPLPLPALLSPLADYEALVGGAF